MTFTARYHGTCAACSEHINPGDQVAWVADDVVHTDCENPNRPQPPPAAVVCEECWMTKPCWCDDTS